VAVSRFTPARDNRAEELRVTFFNRFSPLVAARLVSEHLATDTRQAPLEARERSASPRVVDDEPSTAAVPTELRRLGESVSPDFYVEADRIKGDLWEVRVTRL
jgi:hypothetical protein